MICRKLETDDDKMKYRFLINYTEFADREKKQKRKKKRKEIIILLRGKRRLQSEVSFSN